MRDVHPGAVDPVQCPHHRVTLESVDPGSHGHLLQVIWEREVRTRVHNALGLPAPPEDGRWDPLDRFEAFLLATRWSRASALEALPLQAPFRGAIRPEDFQLEAVVRAIGMPRVNLLIADFVGAGKTIEAGMVVQEMLARQRARRILILCPASLQLQWKEEMEEKFALRFEVVDREYVQSLRREYGIHVNPWASHPRLITSMDFLKRDEPRTLFLDCFGPRHGGLPRAWDLLVVDEVHNAAPAGRAAYVRDSDRTKMLREVLPHFEHRLFLTATPHNGFTESFTALLEMLDPLRFSRGPVTDRKTFEKHRDAVMIRRVKEDIVDDLGRALFPERVLDPPLEVTLDDRERELLGLLDAYIASFAGGHLASSERFAVNFVLELLKKRLLSSPEALRKSIDLHRSHLNQPDAAPEGDGEERIRRYRRQLEEEHADDREKDETEEAATAEATVLFKASAAQIALVEQMQAAATALAESADTKARRLLGFIEEHLRPGGTWGRERLVVFTEYRDTLEYLWRLLDEKGWSDRVLTFTGGLSVGERQKKKRAFQSDPADHPVRVLLATDAASEGLNLQNHCRRLIHYEIPWSPNRMEQRNGRIDRHGQPAPQVFCLHFRYTNSEDQRFLDVIVDKVRHQRDDLGAVSPVIAKGIADCLLRRAQTVPDDARHRLRQSEDLRASVDVAQDLREASRRRIRELRESLRQARETWQLGPENLKKVLHEALRLEGSSGLVPVNEGDLADRAYDAVGLLPWPDLRRCLQDEKGRRRSLVFPQDLKRDDPLFRRHDVVLLHLDHPLIVRALRVFRSRMWDQGIEAERGLCRVTYKVVPDDVAGAIHVVALARVVATNTSGQRVHEEIVPVGGALRGGDLNQTDEASLRRLLEAPGKHPEITGDLGAELRRLFPAHRRRIEALIEKIERSQAERVQKKLAAVGKLEARKVEDLIDERIEEIRARIEKMSPRSGVLQLEFDFAEQEQYDDDLSALKRRLDALLGEREETPEAMRRRYVVDRAAVRAFPLGLLYVLPASTKGIRGEREKEGIVTHQALYDDLRRLEMCLREAVVRSHPREEWTLFLSPERLERVRGLQKLKEAGRPGVGLIECLQLADFVTVILKSPEVRRRSGLGDESRKAVKRQLGYLETLRNRVAHHEDLARSIEELAKVEKAREDLVDLLDTIESALAAGDRP